MPWLGTQALRLFVKNLKTDDEAWLQMAVETACGKVEELCGPIAITTLSEGHDIDGGSICLGANVRSVVSIAGQVGGTYTVTDWEFNGQVLRRRLGATANDVLTVTYTAGYFDADDANAEPPIWATYAALLIAQQWLRTSGRFATTMEPGPVGFLVPFAATEAMRDHLLAPDGFA